MVVSMFLGTIKDKIVSMCRRTSESNEKIVLKILREGRAMSDFEDMLVSTSSTLLWEATNKQEESLASFY